MVIFQKFYKRIDKISAFSPMVVECKEREKSKLKKLSGVVMVGIEDKSLLIIIKLSPKFSVILQAVFADFFNIRAT